MNEVEEFIYGFEGETLEVMKYLHDLMMDQPGISCKISFKIPFYYRNSWICYVSPQKKGGIEFVFTRGYQLSNEQGILEARGRKEVAGIYLKLSPISHLKVSLRLYRKPSSWMNLFPIKVPFPQTEKNRKLSESP